MSDPHRRSPRDDDDEPLRFDDRRGDDRRSHRPRRRGGPAPVTLILSLLVLGGVGGGVFYMYRAGARGSNDAPQPVGAPLRDVRTAAPPQAQAADPAAGLSIYKDDPNASVPPAFVPAPEQPTARPGVATPPPPVPTEAAASVPVVSPVKPKASVASPMSVDDILDPPAKHLAAKPKTMKPVPDPSDVVAVKPVAIKSAAAKPDVAKPVVAKPGPAIVQIGAFSSETLADRAWSAAAAIAPGAMAGKGKRVVPLEKDGATLYRTAITGFASHDSAAALCDKLKAAGRSCFVR